MGDLDGKLFNYLLTYKKSTIWLEEIERVFTGELIDYSTFASIIIRQQMDGILTPMKSTGTNGRKPVLHLRFKIQSSKIRSDFHRELNRIGLKLHPLIQLERYYALGERIFQNDLEWIMRINTYLNNHGLPDSPEAAPARSHALVQDEKWITDKGGREILIRIGLWDQLLVTPEYDPLMMAINPSVIRENISSPCLHLIVENKATYHALLPELENSQWATLIYGSGNKIVGNIELFGKQYPVRDKEHLFYYFGDIDATGIQIWHDLSQKQKVEPAIPFYLACLQKPYSYGKEYQRLHERAFDSFLRYFDSIDQQLLKHCLTGGGYYPQETLSTPELQAIWRDMNWKK